MVSTPTSGTNVRLLSGVPFNQDYKDSRWFANASDQQNYFLGQNILYTASDHNYQRNEKGIFLSINKRYEEVMSSNYLMFQNTVYSNKWFYAFVTHIEYINTNRTNIYFEIDVLQTWMFDLNFQPSYVVREHMGTSSNPIASTDGTPATIFHQDEGLDYGTDYDVVDVKQWIPYSDGSSSDPITNSVFYLVIVTKQPMHDSASYSSGSLKPKSHYNGGITPLNYYVHPFRMDTSTVGTSLGSISSPLDVLNAMYSFSSSVNDVVSIYITDYLGFNAPYDSTTNQVDISTPFSLVTITDNITSASVSTLYHASPSVFYDSMTHDFGAKYDGFNSVSEPKLYMYPYCVVSLEDFRGNRVDLKPEYIYDTNIRVSVRGGLGTENNVAYTVDSYNAGSLNADDQFTVSIETGLIDTNPNDVPVIVDMLSAYFQGNKNTLRNQRNTITTNAAIDAVGSGIGIVASVATGNIAGVASSATGMAKGAANAYLQQSALNAKIKDIGNTPPQLSKMGSNTSFDYGNGWKGIYVVKRQIKQEYRDKLSDFFKMYGYKSNRVKVPNLNTRASWNYIQTSDAFISGNFNNEDKVQLEDIFNKGITLWHTNQVGDYTQSNGVVS